MFCYETFQNIKWLPKSKEEQKILKPRRGFFSSPDLSMQAKKDPQKSGVTVPSSFFTSKYVGTATSPFENNLTGKQ